MTPRTGAVRPATAVEIDEILGWTHPLWGDGHDLATYRARTRAQLATPWGREHYRFHVATDGGGAPVAACKVYGFGPVIGFGAVFTRPDRRGEGHAARMLRALMARPGGARAALLFSDIGPAFYARLGFRALGTLEGEAPALPGPAPWSPWEGPPPPAPGAGDALALAGGAAYRDYLVVRHAPEILCWRGGAGRALVHAAGDALHVDEAGVGPGHDLVGLLGDLRRLAGARGLRRVRGWLPPAAAGAGFALAPVADGVPMAAALAGNGGAMPAHVWAIDHF